MLLRAVRNKNHPVMRQRIELALVRVLFARNLELKKYQLSVFSWRRKFSLVKTNWFD